MGGILRRIAVLAVCAFAGPACGSGANASDSPDDKDAHRGDGADDTSGWTDARVDGATPSGDATTDGTSSDGGIVSVTIEPAAPVVEVRDGTPPPPRSMRAIGRTTAGDAVALSGSWSFDRDDLGMIDASAGTFRARTDLGGRGVVMFASGSLRASTALTVKLYLTSDPGSVAAGVEDAFASAISSDPALDIVYPYDRTVFARGELGPGVQWNQGSASDVYYVRVSSSTFEFDAWGSAPPPSRYRFPTTPLDVWAKMTQSVEGDLTFSIQR